MTSAATEEGTHTLPDGVKLYTKTWKASGEHKANLAFVHGFSDHCNAYGRFFPLLAAKGIQTYAFDQRGWGQSVRKDADKGNSGPTKTVIDDITSFIKSIPPSSAPLFLMGHSMGGAEVLTFVAEGPPDVRRLIRGFLAESPFIALDPKTKPSVLTVFFGRLAAKVLPQRHLRQQLETSFISRDPEVVKEYEEDELCFDMGTLEGLSGMLDRAEFLEKGKYKLPNDAGEGGVTRVWVAHGTSDYICSYPGTKKWFDELQIDDKHFKSYDGWYHKLHNEPGEDKETFANDVANWILAKCTEPIAESATSKPKL